MQRGGTVDASCVDIYIAVEQESNDIFMPTGDSVIERGGSAQRVVRVHLSPVGDELLYNSVMPGKRGVVERHLTCTAFCVDIGTLGHKCFHHIFVPHISRIVQRGPTPVALRVDLGTVGNEELDSLFPPTFGRSVERRKTRNMFRIDIGSLFKEPPDSV